MSNGQQWVKDFPELAAIIPVARKSAPAPKAKRATVRAPLPPPSREGDTLVITLWLNPQLQPNRKKRLHYMTANRVTREARDTAELLARIVAPSPPWKAVRIDVESWTAKKLDDDGMIGWLKATRDGIADGLGMNDRDFVQGEVVQNINGKRDGERKIILRLTRIS